MDVGEYFISWSNVPSATGQRRVSFPDVVLVRPDLICSEFCRLSISEGAHVRRGVSLACAPFLFYRFEGGGVAPFWEFCVPGFLLLLLLRAAGDVSNEYPSLRISSTFRESLRFCTRMYLFWAE